MKKMRKMFLIVFVNIVLFSQYLEIPEITVYGEKEIDILPAKKNPLFFVIRPDSFILGEREIRIIEDKFEEKYIIKNFGFYTKFSIGSFFDTNLVAFDEKISFFAQNEYIPVFLNAEWKRDFKFYDYHTEGNISTHPVQGHSLFFEYSKIRTDSVEEIFSLNYLFNNRSFDLYCGFLTKNSKIFFLSDFMLRFKNLNLSFSIFDLFFPDSNLTLYLTYDIYDNLRFGLSFKKYPLPIFTYIFPVNAIFLKGEFSKSRFPFEKNIHISYNEKFFISDLYRVSLGFKYAKCGYTALFKNDSIFHGISFSFYNPFIFNIYYFLDGHLNIKSDIEIKLFDRFHLTLLSSFEKELNLITSADFNINNYITLFVESVSSYQFASFNMRTGLKIKKVF